jgi:hypothetical protein
MRIQIKLTGTTPLLLHNERLSDPDYEITKQIKQLTDKGQNQTELDKAQISRLEWQGSLYTNGTRELIMPAANIVKCFRETGAYTKEGKKVAGGLSPLNLYFPLLHDGPKDLEELYNKGPYIDRRQVKIGRSRIKRTRPIFPRWEVIADFELFEDVLDYSRLERIAADAGRAQGLCDARILGYGRFLSEIKKLGKAGPG